MNAKGCAIWRDPARYDSTASPKASQSGFSQTKPESITFEVSAGSAVTPQAEQIGARPTSRSSSSLIRFIIPEEALPGSICSDASDPNADCEVGLATESGIAPGCSLCQTLSRQNSFPSGSAMVTRESMR
jgi:hypothetical protein